MKQKLEKEKAKKYSAWVRRTRAEEKEKAKGKKKEQEKGKVLSCEKRFVGGGWCGGCGGWWLWWVLLASLPIVVEAAVPGACCLAGLWTFLPLGILAFMAPKKRPAARGVEQGAGGQQNPGESAGSAGEGGGATEAPKRRRKRGGESAEEDGGVVAARKKGEEGAEEGVGQVAAEDIGGGAAGSVERPTRRRKKADQICLARVWGGIQCTFKAKPESKFCGIHTHSQTYGTVEEVPATKEELPENVEGPLAVVPGGEAPGFQVQQDNLDIDMFLLKLPVQEITKVSAFWQSQQGPPLKIFSERPSLYQLFSHPLALFFEKPESASAQEWKEEVRGAFYAASVELPLPAPPNPYNRECVVRRTTKCHWNFGCKVPVAAFEQAFSMGQAFLEGQHLTLHSKKRLWPACVCSVWQMARELSS